MAIVITDHLKTHPSTGSLFVRGMHAELREHLHLVYTPAPDPEANQHSLARAASRDGSLRIIISVACSNFCLQIWSSIFEHSPKPQLRSFVTSGVPLPLKRIKALLCHTLRLCTRPWRNECWTPCIAR